MQKVLGMGNALVDILSKIESDSKLSDLSLAKGSMQLIDNNCVDCRCPMFFNSNGTALSMDGYMRRVKSFGDYVLNSDEATLKEVREYLLETNSRFTGDLLRHWYAVNIMHMAEQKCRNRRNEENVECRK